MIEIKKPVIYASVCSKSKKMSDYDFILENKTLYLTNKITKEIDFVILDVNPRFPKRYLLLTKLLLLSDFTLSKYYTIKDLKNRFKDIKIKNKFKSLKSKESNRSKNEFESLAKTNDSIRQNSTDSSKMCVNDNSENSMKVKKEIKFSSFSKNLKKCTVNTKRKNRKYVKLSSHNKISTVTNFFKRVSKEISEKILK